MAIESTCIVITCGHPTWVYALEEEILLLRKKHFLSNRTEILTIEDPSEHIGSGATLMNALVVAAEYLSAEQGYTTIVGDVFQNASIVVMPHGRHYLFDACGKPFINLPKTSHDGNLFDVVTSLENSLNLILNMCNKAPGVWFCSTDMFLSSEGVNVRENDVSGKDAVLFSVKTVVDYATKHGCVISENNVVQKIIYCASHDVLQKYSQNNFVSVVSGIVYLSPNVAETLLSLHSSTPLESCTYLGIDSGFSALPMSLYFDFLMAMASDVSESDFVLGKHCTTYNAMKRMKQEHITGMQLARKVIWDRLSKFRLTDFSMANTKLVYWDENITFSKHISNIFTASQCFMKDAQETIVLNSVIDESLAIGKGSLICHTRIPHVTESSSIGSDCFLSNVECSSNERICIPNSVAVVGYHVMSNDQTIRSVFVLGVNDNVWLPFTESSSTVCNIPWHDFFLHTGLVVEDIWEDYLKPEERTLWNAKIFLIPSSLNDYQWFFDDCPRPENWQAARKTTLSEIVKVVDLKSEFLWRRELKALLICKHIEHCIQNNYNASLVEYFKLSFVEEWPLKILETLDRLGEEQCDNSIILGRIISCIADLLGTMAGKFGLIRSGPGSNKLWRTGFDCLENDDARTSLSIFKAAREKWLARSDHLVRAARHYERALQILIQKAVMTSRHFVCCSDCEMPKMCQWIQAECPVRVDLQGGWTDTPPICYEQGGCVVNIAITVDGLKPVGAKARRIEKKHLVFGFGKEGNVEKFVVNHLSDLMDYNQPGAVGALIKAAVICAEIVDIRSGDDLNTQLTRYGSGFEICIWSNLPHGSGMGTSSILAGAVIAVLWGVAGRSYTKEAIIHAVLYIEQLMTTGGGWQDQVGGIVGGVKRGFSLPQLPLEVHIEELILSNEFISLLNSHLLLLYTGKVRLAKNLLQNVIRNWYAKNDDVVRCFADLKSSAESLADAFRSFDLKKIGSHMNDYWTMKKILAPGCEPVVVGKLMQYLKNDTLGQVLAGAGGGGFLCVLTVEPDAKETVKIALQNDETFKDVSVHTIELDLEGMVVNQ